MSANASLTIVGGPQRIEPGRETTLTAQIVNLGTVPDDFRLSVREIDPAWVTFRPPTVFLQPGDQAIAAIVITPPLGIPAGALRPTFRLLSRRAGNVAIVEIAMPTPTATAPPPYQPPPRAQTPSSARHTPPPRPIIPPVQSAPAPALDPEPVPTVPRQPDTSPAPPRRRRTLSPIARGVVGILLLALLLGGVIAALLQRGTDPPADGEPTIAAVEATTVQPLASTQATATAVIAPQVLPSRTPTTAFVARAFVVANTGGQGVYLRRTANIEDRDTAYEDGTRLTQIGPDVQAGGLTWHQVRTPDGKNGFVPAQYTQDAP